MKNRGCHFVILTQICRLLLPATARGNEVEFFWVLLIVKSHWNTVIYVIYNDHWNQRHICFFIINNCLPLKICSSYELPTTVHYQKSKFENMYLNDNFYFSHDHNVGIHLAIRILLSRKGWETIFHVYPVHLLIEIGNTCLYSKVSLSVDRMFRVFQKRYTIYPV